MAVPYWRSEDRWAARALLLVVVMLNLGIVYLNALLNKWNNAPRYFRGAIHLGDLVQTVTAFGQVQDSLSFIVSSYTDIAAWRSVVERLLA